MSEERQKRKKRRRKKRKKKSHSAGSLKVKQTSHIQPRKKKRRRKKRPQKNKWLANLKLLSLSFLIVFLLVTCALFFIKPLGQMKGYSMMPEVSNKDIFSVNRFSKIGRFDLVYIEGLNNSQDRSVRRVIGVPGDELFYKNDALFINNEGKPENYLESRKAQLAGGILTEDFNLQSLTGKTKVPEENYFVLGDNRQSSADSRDYGFVSSDRIIGKVEMRVFPLNTIKRY